MFSHMFSTSLFLWDLKKGTQPRSHYHATFIQILEDLLEKPTSLSIFDLYLVERSLYSCTQMMGRPTLCPYLMDC